MALQPHRRAGKRQIEHGLSLIPKSTGEHRGYVAEQNFPVGRCQSNGRLEQIDRRDTCLQRNPGAAMGHACIRRRKSRCLIEACERMLVLVQGSLKQPDPLPQTGIGCLFSLRPDERQGAFFITFGERSSRQLFLA
jgi:hypothetical protein